MKCRLLSDIGHLLNEKLVVFHSIVIHILIQVLALALCDKMSSGTSHKGVPQALWKSPAQKTGILDPVVGG